MHSIAIYVIANFTSKQEIGSICAIFAGKITSSNFSAHPSEVLLQATPPHRRARTPVWSYHFLPEESFLELLVSLPCAILLKEVQIVPHITSSASSKLNILTSDDVLR